MLKKLAILDPRNIQGSTDVCRDSAVIVISSCIQSSWETYSDLFGPSESEGSPEEVRSIEAELKVEWTRYTQVWFCSKYPM